MSAETLFEAGRLGRIALIRLKPNQDLVEGVEAACVEAGLTHGMVRSAVGSLVDGVLGYGAGDSRGLVTVEGPGIEILTLGGAPRRGRPAAGPSGRYHLGRRREGLWRHLPARPEHDLHHPGAGAPGMDSGRLRGKVSCSEHWYWTRPTAK
jgi:hypothetical protein